MRTKPKLLIGLAVALFLGAGYLRDDPIQNEIEELQGKLSQAFIAQDVDAIRRLVTSDHIAITSTLGKPIPLEEQMKTLSDYKLTKYSPGKMTITQLGDTAVLNNYTVSLEGSFRGKATPARAFVSTIWVRESGRWRERLYQETPLEAP
jgi:hypothetical protein